MFTLDKNIDFTLTVLSLVAEEESHKKSEAMNASYFMRFSQGDYMIPSLLGYKRVGVNEIAIDEEEAKTVRLIFDMYRAGAHPEMIANVLMKLGRKTHQHTTKNGKVIGGRLKWTANSVIRQIVVGGLTSAYCLAYRRFLAGLTADGRTECRYPKKECGGNEDIAPDTEWLTEFSNAGGWHILLSHHPEYWPLIAPQPIELCLSAHAHGGQWRFLNHGVFALGQGFWPKFTSGIYYGRLVVSRGLSNTAKVPRLLNPLAKVFSRIHLLSLRFRITQKGTLPFSIEAVCGSDKEIIA